MRLRVGHQHSQFWLILACFMDYYSLFWGPGLISTSNEPCHAFTCRYQHSQFWPILARFVEYYSLFWGNEVISTINEPRVRLRFGHQHLRFCPILAFFVYYYSLFWGPGVISMINEPMGALMCRSSTLTVLADSGPFRGLLLTVLGSRSDVHE